jgi:hypothetical protein
MLTFLAQFARFSCEASSMFSDLAQLPTAIDPSLHRRGADAERACDVAARGALLVACFHGRERELVGSFPACSLLPSPPVEQRLKPALGFVRESLFHPVTER